MTMRAESRILELVETADIVAIAAPVREIADSSSRSHVGSRIGRGSQLPPPRLQVHEIAVWCQAAMACEA